MKREQKIPAAVGILKTGGAKFPPLLIHVLPPDEKIPRILRGGAGVDERLFVRLLAGRMYRELFGCAMPGIAYTPDGAPYVPAPGETPVSAHSVRAENGADTSPPLQAQNTEDRMRECSAGEGALPCPHEAFSVSFSHTKGYVCVAFALPAPSQVREEAAKAGHDSPLIVGNDKYAENPEKAPASTPASEDGGRADKEGSRSLRIPGENRGGQKRARWFAGAAVGVDIERADALSDPERQQKLAERFLRRVPAAPPDSTHPITVMGWLWDPEQESMLPLTPTESVGACLHAPNECCKEIFTYHQKTLPFAGIKKEEAANQAAKGREDPSCQTGKTELSSGKNMSSPAGGNEQKGADPWDFIQRFTALEATLKAAGGGFAAYPQLEEWMRKTARYTARLTFPDAQIALSLALAPEGVQQGEAEIN